MYTGKIKNYTFELDSDVNRINVYREGAGIDPVSLITVKPGISEKEFHYEIMDYISKLERGL